MNVQWHTLHVLRCKLILHDQKFSLIGGNSTANDGLPVITSLCEQLN